MIPFHDPLSDPFAFVVMAIVGVLAIERILHLWVDDEYPPLEWVKVKYLTWVGDSPWKELATCPWCSAPYITAVFMGWWALDYTWLFGDGLHWSWWAGNTLAAVSWMASFLNLRDVPPESRE